MARPPFPDRRRFAFRGLLCLGRVGLLPGAGLADAGADPRPVLRVPQRRPTALHHRAGNGLLGALAYFGLPAIDAAEKAEMRELAMRPGDHTEGERAALLDYCETDVVALAKLLPAMLPQIDLPRALLRGRYMAAVAAMEWNGVPIDVATLDALRTNWEAHQRAVDRADRRGLRRVRAGGAGRSIRLRASAPSCTAPPTITASTRITLAEAARDVWAGRRATPTASSAKRCGGSADRADAAPHIGDGKSPARIIRRGPGLDVTARTIGRRSIPRWASAAGTTRTAPSTTPTTPGSCGICCATVCPARSLDMIVEILDQAARIGGVQRHAQPTEPVVVFRAAVRRVAGPGRDPVAAVGSGGLALDDDTFRQMARTIPAVAPLAGAAACVGRNAAVLGPGRRQRRPQPLSAVALPVDHRPQPAEQRAVHLRPVCWLRCLIQPRAGPGRGLRRLVANRNSASPRRCRATRP